MSAKSFWDRIAPKYARQPVNDPAAYAEKLARVRSLLRASDRVLEIGCGTGSTALKIAPRVAQITATDASRCMIEIARVKLGPGAPTNITFQLNGAADMVRGQPFDAILAFSLLHLIKDVPHVLGCIRQQVKPGGLFISKTECLKDRSILLRAMVPALVAIGLAPRVTFFSSDELVQQIQAAGFEIEQTSYFGANRLSQFIVARRPVA
ncbi:MAG: class I SAM-dependent methyltransferase [Parvibaculaceae bacterium]